MRKIYAFILLFINFLANGQVWKEKFFVHLVDTVKLDSLALVPDSVLFFRDGQQIKVKFADLWYRGEIVVFQAVDSVKVVYKVFPFSFKTRWREDSIEVVSVYQLVQEVVPRDYELTEETGINVEGTVSRGMWLGNNLAPDANSEVKLKISGKIDSFNVLGNLNLNTLSTQLQGNFGFQDFNKSLIKIWDNANLLQIGDISVRDSNSYFIEFERVLKGISYVYRANSALIGGAIGVQKGIFNRLEFMGEDANQGPYKLLGKFGEFDIVILQGTDNVWVNGRKCVNGKDYKLDYARAELTFLPNCPITSDSRIIVEFQYWNLDFVRVFNQFEYRKKTTNGEFFATYASFYDSRVGFLESYDSELLAQIAKAGDSTIMAVMAKEDPSGDYCQKDTIWNGRIFKIFVYSPDSDCQKWKVNFEYVGQGKGEYVQTVSQLNAQIFKWVGPGKGDYSPFKQVIVPQKKDMLSAGFNYKINNYSTFKLELTRSNFDKNRLSSLDDQDNQALAMHSNLEININNLKLNAFYNFTSKNFSYFDQFLPVEFKRDWSLNSLSLQNWQFAGLDANLYKILSISSKFMKLPNYKGIKNDFLLHLKNSNFWLSNNYAVNDSLIISFTRTIDTIAHTTKSLSYNLRLEAEKQLFKIHNNISPFSYQFFDLQPFITFKKQNLFAKLQLTFRQNYSYNQNWLKTKSIQAISASVQTKFKKSQQNLSLYLSKIQLDTITLTSIAVNWLLTAKIFPKNVLNINLLAQTENLPFQRFYFVQVPTGLGSYSWIDFNHDGKQQIYEFQPAQFPDQANFIKITVPTNEKTKILNLNSHIDFRQNIGKTSLNLSFTSNPKIVTDSLSKLYNNLTLNALLQHQFKTTTLELANQHSNFYDFIYGGLQFQKQNIYKLKLNFQLAENSLAITVDAGNYLSISQLYPENNYSYSNYALHFSYQTNNSQASISSIYFYTDTSKMAISNFFNLTTQLLKTNKLTINLLSTLSYNIPFISIPTHLQYLIFQGYSSGLNAQIQLLGTYRFSNTVQLQTTAFLRWTNSSPTFNLMIRLVGQF